MDVFKNRFRDLQKQEDSSLALVDVSRSIYPLGPHSSLHPLGMCGALKDND